VVVPPPRPESRRASTARPECSATASSNPLLRPLAEFRRVPPKEASASPDPASPSRCPRGPPSCWATGRRRPSPARALSSGRPAWSPPSPRDPRTANQLRQPDQFAVCDPRATREI